MYGGVGTYLIGSQPEPAAGTASRQNAPQELGDRRRPMEMIVTLAQKRQEKVERRRALDVDIERRRGGSRRP